jgi:hypothetical protein
VQLLLIVQAAARTQQVFLQQEAAAGLYSIAATM